MKNNYSNKYGVSKLEGISAAILKKPEGDKKGAILLQRVDAIVDVFPNLSDHFYLIEWRGWKGRNYFKNADIKLVEDGSTYLETTKIFPKAIALDTALGDFIDVDTFKPLDLPKKYSALQMVSWMEFKRHDLFLEATKLLPEKKFLKFGHFPNKNDKKCLELKTNIVGENKGSNIYFPYGHIKGNGGLPSTSEEVNKHINSAKMGILTSQVEGMNRFKMECLSADLPFLVPADSNHPIKKHINETTGVIYELTPKGLAEAICHVENNLSKFKPREYILKNTGRLNSTARLENALNYLAVQDGDEPHFKNIFLDGRNKSLLWKENALDLIQSFYEDK
jgi:hypothetical protein